MQHQFPVDSLAQKNMIHRLMTGFEKQVGAQTIFLLSPYHRYDIGMTVKELGTSSENPLTPLLRNPILMILTQHRNTNLLLRLALIRRTRKGLVHAHAKSCPMIYPKKAHSNDGQGERHAQIDILPRTRGLEGPQQRPRKSREKSPAHKSIFFDQAKTS
jgi:hypothetical protein